MEQIKAGDVFLVDHPINAPTPHFCIAITNEYGNPPSVIIVPINTKTKTTDPTVTLNAGDHECIKHPSSVTYNLAVSLSVVYLESKIITNKVSLSNEILERVIAGALESKRTPNGIKRKIKEIQAANKHS